MRGVCRPEDAFQSFIPSVRPEDALQSVILTTRPEHTFHSVIPRSLRALGMTMLRT